MRLLGLVNLASSPQQTRLRIHPGRHPRTGRPTFATGGQTQGALTGARPVRFVCISDSGIKHDTATTHFPCCATRD
jgi:hypothetical protein